MKQVLTFMLLAPAVACTAAAVAVAGAGGIHFAILFLGCYMCGRFHGVDAFVEKMRKTNEQRMGGGK